MYQTLRKTWQLYSKVKQDLESSAISAGHRYELMRQADTYRDRLVVNYAPIVKYVAGQIYARVPEYLSQEDLTSWGLVGLLQAVETFDLQRHTKFESYAISKIRWAILDEIREQDWVPRSVRRRVQEVERVTIDLTHRLKRVPTDLEISEEMGIKLKEYRNFMDQYSRAQIASLEARIELEGGLGRELQALINDPDASDPQSEADHQDLRDYVVAAISTLEKQERIVATFYFYEGLTLKEIGKALGLTEGRVSQIRRNALLKLKDRLLESSFAMKI